MRNFFIEGGALMWPVLVLGLLVVVSAVRYMLDGEPVRLRFITVCSLALLATVALAVVLDVSAVLAFLAHVPPEQFRTVVVVGLKESSRPAILGFGLLGVALDLVVIGAYRLGRRE